MPRSPASPAARCSSPPGTDYSYSGPGIMVAAAVVERVTGQHYTDVLQDKVLTPAGMSGTFTTANQVIARRVAAPHGRTTDGDPTLLIDQSWQRHWQPPGWDVPGGGRAPTRSPCRQVCLFRG
ncbi:serine hydrolase [Streptomyces sp. NPDC001142]